MNDLIIFGKKENILYFLAHKTHRDFFVADFRKKKKEKIMMNVF
jgi:hypothetical protein